MDLVSRLANAAAVVGKNGITKSRDKYAELYREAMREITANEAEIQRLQCALAFWLPCVPADYPEGAVADRICNDSFLLGGYEGDFTAKSAEDLGWIRLQDSAGAGSADKA